VIDRLAKQGDDRADALPTTRLTHADRNAPELKGDLDFSFSGLKTAVLRHVRAHDGPLSEHEIADVCASFQRIVVTVLIDRLFDAARRHHALSVLAEEDPRVHTVSVLCYEFGAPRKRAHDSIVVALRMLDFAGAHPSSKQIGLRDRGNG